jgi:hypothetical protein
MQNVEVVVGDREAANVTLEGKTIIKSELRRLYPDYNPVATLPNMLDYNIDAVAKEISIEVHIGMLNRLLSNIIRK